jgi:N-formylglutamate amidohydrolase
MILNIPHASSKIYERGLFLVNDETLKKELFYSTDWFTDELFVYDASTRLIADKSRLHIDMERFNDSREYDNNNAGRGIIYTKTLDGFRLKTVENYDISEYIDYHKKLESFVEQYHGIYPVSVIVDCHSFQEGIGYRIAGIAEPDICIGFTDYNAPDQYLILKIYKYLSSKGYKVSFNYPYSGSICPDRYATHRDKVQSIMIEVNRKLYMRNEDFVAIKTDNFDNLKADIFNVLEIISNYEAGMIIVS